MPTLIDTLKNTESKIKNAILEAESFEQLEQIKIDFLAKKGPLKEVRNQLVTLPNEQKAEVGKALNKTLQTLSNLWDKQSKKLTTQKISTLSQKEWIDLTLPGEKHEIGHLHPITQIRYEAEDIFMKMGFEVIEPRLVDTDFNVFEALNIPKGHPARDMWDTFWTTDGHIPITHTSAMQNRILSSKEVPIRAIVPGRCFRNEATDATHEHTFYQIEGVYLDKNITLADLIGTLKTFLSAFYNQDVQLKIQPSYFPFVEPGLEILLKCVICNGSGETDGERCHTCRGSKWIELVPAGPIHPNVLRMAEKDPSQYSGFAWGLGLDRLAMIRYAIEDIRWFHSGDLRFIKQF